jgi:hypothetical protein
MKQRIDAYHKALGTLSDFISNPDKLSAQVVANTSEISGAAPKTTAALQNIALNGVNYLHAAAPKSDSQPMLIPGDDYQPSVDELSSFERKVAAVHNPLSILKDLRLGRLTDDAVEAVKAVYPQFYQDLQSQMMRKLSSGQYKLDSQQKLGLGILFQAPIENVQEPDFLVRLQQNFNQNAQGTMNIPQANNGINMGGVSKMEKSERTTSDAEKIGRGE